MKILLSGFPLGVLMVAVCLLFVGLPADASDQVEQYSLEGLVLDSGQNPVAGASVWIKGSTIGTVTGSDGSFSLDDINGDGTLMVSFIGYKTCELEIDGRGYIEVVLEEDMKFLDEVVVMAYNSTIKRKVVSSVTNVDVKQVEQISGYKS